MFVKTFNQIQKAADWWFDFGFHLAGWCIHQYFLKYTFFFYYVFAHDLWLAMSYIILKFLLTVLTIYFLGHLHDAVTISSLRFRSNFNFTRSWWRTGSQNCCCVLRLSFLKCNKVSVAFLRRFSSRFLI